MKDPDFELAAFLRKHAPAAPPPPADLEERLLLAATAPAQAAPPRRRSPPWRVACAGLLATAAVAATVVASWRELRQTSAARVQTPELEHFIETSWDGVFDDGESLAVVP